VAINASVTYTAPAAIGKMYDSLQSWSGIDIFGLFGQGALWVAAMFAVGCYLAWSLGFHLICEYSPAPFLIARTVSLAVILFVWIPALIAHDSLDPNRTIVKPLLVAFCLLYYIIFESLRTKFGFWKPKDSGGERKYSIPKLVIVTVVMAILLIPYLHTVYLFIDSWATLIVVGLAVLFANGRSKSVSEQKAAIDAMHQRERARYDDYMTKKRLGYFSKQPWDS
jgi:hypothetical protein